MVFMAPRDKPGYMEKDQFAVPIISCLNNPIEAGKPCPPYSSGAESPCQPPITYWLYASLKPFGVVTSPLSSLQPSSSPLWYSGLSTSSQNRPHSVRIASTMSGVAFSPDARL